MMEDKMYNNLYTVEEVADFYNCSVHAIYGHCKNLGITKNKFGRILITFEQREKIAFCLIGSGRPKGSKNKIKNI